MRWCSGKESAFQCRRLRRLRFDPYVRKISWRRKWSPTPVFLLGNSKDTETWKSTVREVAKSWTQLSTHAHRVEKPVNNFSKKQLKMFKVGASVRWAEGWL